MTQRVLVTGATGYIGTIMTRVLREHGYLVVATDIDYYRGCNLGPISDVCEIRKDVRDLSTVDLQGFEAVVHLAALCNDPLGDLNAEVTYDINHRASVRLARIAKEAGVQRFIFASSCSMYGAAQGDDLLTEAAPLNPLTPYAESKVRTETDLHHLAGPTFSPVSMRNATAYGFSPRWRADVVLNNLVGWAYTTGKVLILSDGTPWRPIVHVQDICLAVAAALTAPREAVHDQAFNVGVDSENYQVRDLARFVQEVVPGCTIEYAGEGGPDPRNYRVDFSKIRRVLPEFKPRWTARAGAEELYDALRSYGVDAAQFQSRRFVRLKQIQHLMAEGYVDETLRRRGMGVA
jgi:nucleoside-diphosphate-sugar epimerase